MTVSAIVAAAENGVIGRAGKLPWHLPADLKRFKALTLGHAIIMGRRTYESIGRPLPGRTSIVLTRRADYAPEGILTAGSLDEALVLARVQQEVAAPVAGARGTPEAFIIGGAAVFAEALPECDRVYLTLVRAEVEGDAVFPLSRLDAFVLAEEADHPADARHAVAFTFRTYLRAGSGPSPPARDAAPPP
jgi:dihydrofolate reductase